MKNKLYLLITALTITVIDQVTKHIISNSISFTDKIPLIKGYLSLINTQNTGAAFSLFEGNTHLLALVSTIAVIGITVYFLKNTKRLPISSFIACSLLIGGALGNLADRVLLGHVIDFIYLEFINFPVFNIADIAINIGAFIILLKLLLTDNFIYNKSDG